MTYSKKSFAGTSIVAILAVTTLGSQPVLAQTAEELRALIEAQQQQMEEQARQLEEMRQRLEELAAAEAETRATAEAAASQAAELADEDLVSSGTSRIELAISGQINRAINVGADGNRTKVYNVDNDNSSSRLRFVGTGRPNETVTVGTVLEVELESNSSNDVSQVDDFGRDGEDTGTVSFKDRKVEAFIEEKSLGRITIGQGSTASDGSSEVDLSGTTVIGYSKISDLAGGLLFYDDDAGAYADTSINDAFDNFDGLSRRDRIRYDTPKIAGFTLAADLISDQRWSTALRWGGDFGGVKAAAAIAYSDPGGDSDFIVNGSASAVHTPSGLSLTVAAGTEDNEGRDDGTTLYGKLGWEADLLTIGSTAFSIDYNRIEDIDDEGDEGDSVGILAVQNLSDWGVELFAGYRWHSLDRDGADFDDIHVVTGGSRVKF